MWEALTDGRRLSAWFGAAVELEADPGGRAVFHFEDGTVRRATVERAEKDHLLVLRWLPFSEDSAGNVEQLPGGEIGFVLEEVDGTTRLRVVERRAGRAPRFGALEPSVPAATP